MTIETISVNKWIYISIYFFVLWALTLYFLNRRINQVKRLRKKLNEHNNPI